MPAVVILNPYAGRWKAKRRWPEAEAALREAGVTFDCWLSEAPGQGTELAQRAATEGHSPVIVAGGDGTIGEVVNGLFRARPEGVLGPIGILPLGTANDLVRNLGLPTDLRAAAKAIAAGRTRRIDLGQVNEWVFANNSAVGLEPVVTIYNIRMVRLRGVVRYLVAALRAILDRPQWEMELAWDEGEYQGPVTLVSVGNGVVTGGLFRMAPDADPADGRLTFVHGYAPTRRRMLALLPRAISGDFVNDPAVHQYHTTRLHIRCDPPTPLQADGEIRGHDLTELTYQVLPARLDVFTP